MSDTYIRATNKATGEMVEMPASTLKEVTEAWRVAQEYEKTAKSLKDQLKKVVPEYIGDKGLSEESNGFAFRQNTIQRMNYDKAVLREQLDADIFDVLTKPDKTAVDKYLKENIDTLGEKSTIIRESMISDGVPYQVIKLEKLDRS